mmetsp:Transcript_49476/g.124092  ORF Transcript_49476/g.124092 Transcript_49476/m.124092 type:complete len:224 (-) Transcript_49476:1212-1883(-)
MMRCDSLCTSSMSTRNSSTTSASPCGAKSRRAQCILISLSCSTRSCVRSRWSFSEASLSLLDASSTLPSSLLTRLLTSSPPSRAASSFGSWLAATSVSLRWPSSRACCTSSSSLFRSRIACASLSCAALVSFSASRVLRWAVLRFLRRASFSASRSRIWLDSISSLACLSCCILNASASRLLCSSSTPLSMSSRFSSNSTLSLSSSTSFLIRSDVCMSRSFCS